MGFQAVFAQGISPWVVGQLFPAWQIQLLYDDSTPQKPHPVDLTGLASNAFTLIIQPVDANGNDIGGSLNGGGTFAVVDAPNGKITYPPTGGGTPDAFLAAAGYFKLRVKVNMAGSLPWFSDPSIMRTDAVS